MYSLQAGEEHRRRSSASLRLAEARQGGGKLLTSRHRRPIGDNQLHAPSISMRTSAMILDQADRFARKELYGLVRADGRGGMVA